MNDDAHLLHCYLDGRSQEAFAALVERHLGLVYHAAVRQLGSAAHQAEDVAQAVFVLLAEKAGSLRGHPSLAGWLHTATRFKVSELRRSEARRRNREETNHAMSEVLSDPAGDAEWAQLRPVIDEVLAELSAADREAVLLRFFEGRSFAEIGGRLRLNEKAAHKRVERALEKVRLRLGRRGIFSTAALATVLGSQAGMAAPAGLIASVSGAAAAVVVIAPASAAGALLAAIQFMTTTKAVVGIAVIALVLASVVGVREVRAREEHAVALAALNRENEGLAARLGAAKALAAQLEQERSKLEAAKARSLVAAQPRAQSNLVDGQALLDAHPELRAALVKALSATLRRELKPFFEELRLTEAQREQILGIRMRARRRVVGAHLLGLSSPELTWEQMRNEMTAVLGEDGFKRYREYETTMPARSFSEELTSRLYYTESPLAREQAEQIQRIVRENIDPRARDRLSEAGWKDLRAYADKSRSRELVAAIDTKYAERLFQEAHIRALKAHTEAAKAAGVSP